MSYCLVGCISYTQAFSKLCLSGQVVEQLLCKSFEIHAVRERKSNYWQHVYELNETNETLCPNAIDLTGQSSMRTRTRLCRFTKKNTVPLNHCITTFNPRIGCVDADKANVCTLDNTITMTFHTLNLNFKCFNLGPNMSQKAKHWPSSIVIHRNINRCLPYLTFLQIIKVHVDQVIDLFHLLNIIAHVFYLTTDRDRLLKE